LNSATGFNITGLGPRVALARFAMVFDFGLVFDFGWVFDFVFDFGFVFDFLV